MIISCKIQYNAPIKIIYASNVIEINLIVNSSRNEDANDFLFVIKILYRNYSKALIFANFCTS